MANFKTLSPYHNWTREDLISKLQRLESEPVHSQPKKEPPLKPFTFDSHPRRKIALKFCYAGDDYNGLAFQKDYTPLPTVEGVLFDALVRTRLIDGDKGFEGCEWDRCGRTDRGVSAAGQVISLWVRSAIGVCSVQKPVDELEASKIVSDTQLEEPSDDLPLMVDLDPPFSSAVPSDDATSAQPEIPYIQVLNRVLPPTIRVLCWSPVQDSFSARFSCQHRHYKYFFPATPDLDILRMRDAAARLVGTHDFRNLCTLDGSKQVENYHRTIECAEISVVGPDESNIGVGAMHVFDLVGNAFLYNQVRSIMAILFLVGAGLEQPHIVSSLMNVDFNNPSPPYRLGEPIQVIDRKPVYQMADALPLVLWECGYADGDVQWQTDGEATMSELSSMVDQETSATTNLRHQMFSIYNRSRIRTTLDLHFLRASAQFHAIPHNPFPLPSDGSMLSVVVAQKTLLNVPLGGGAHIRTAKYQPLLERKRGSSADVVNERWRQGRGKQKWADRLARREQLGSIPADGEDE